MPWSVAPRAEQRPVLGVRSPDLAGIVEELVPDEQRHAQRAAGVPRRRLDPDVVERPLAQDAPVADAVERDAAGQAELAQPGLGVDVARRPQHRLLGNRLDRRGDVHLALGDGRLGPPRRPVEQRVEPARRHSETLAVLEVRHVHAERPVGLQVDQVVPNAVDVLRLPVGREAHQLVLARVHLEAGEVGEGGVQQADRMREADLVRQLDAVAPPGPERGGGPLADAVHREDGGFVERGRKERARRVRLVVLGEDDLPLVASSEPLRDGARQVELLLRPQRHELQERPEAARRVRQVGLQQALELQERLVVEADVVELLGRDAGLVEAVADGVDRERVVVLAAGEPLLLRRRDDVAVDDERRRRVVVEGRDAEDRRHGA